MHFDIFYLFIIIIITTTAAVIVLSAGDNPLNHNPFPRQNHWYAKQSLMY